MYVIQSCCVIGIRDKISYKKRDCTGEKSRESGAFLFAILDRIE